MTDFSNPPIPLLYKDVSLPKKAAGVIMTPVAGHEFDTNSTVNVVNKGLYIENSPGSGTNQEVVPFGVNDKRMGGGFKKACATCGLMSGIKDKPECAGHYGSIKLAFPCFNVGYLKFIKNVLATICKSCSRVLLSPKDKEKYLKKCLRSKNTFQNKREIRKEIYEKCRKIKYCPYCDSLNGDIYSSTQLILTHKRYLKAMKKDPYPTDLAKDKYSVSVIDLQNSAKSWLDKQKQKSLRKYVEDGKVVEQGPHSDLLSRPGSLYSRLVFGR